MSSLGHSPESLHISQSYLACSGLEPIDLEKEPLPFEKVSPFSVILNLRYCQYFKLLIV